MHTFNTFITKYLYKAVKSTILFIVGLLPGISLKAEYIGTFVITYLSLGGGFIFMCLMLGINPTLVMSVISAPIWIFIVYIANKITKVIMEHKEKEEDHEVIRSE